MNNKRRLFDSIAYTLMLASLVCSGIVYGVFAAAHSWVPLPQIRAGIQSFQALQAEFGRHWSIDIPGRRPQVKAPAPERFAPGLLMAVGMTDGPRHFIRIIDRSGEVIHEWNPDWFQIWGDDGDFPSDFRPQSLPGSVVHGVALHESGDVILNFESLSTMRLSPCGEVIWKLDNLGHHSVHIDEEGAIWVSAHTFYQDEAPPFQNHKGPLFSETIQKISPDGEILEAIEVLDVLRRNDLLGLMHMSTKANDNTVVWGDTIHMNDVEIYPEDGDSTIFEPGDILISLRNINSIMVIDPQTLRIKFRMTGRFLRQHDPDFIGGDAILVYDNRNLSPEAGREEAQSRILEVNAATGEVSPRFDGTSDASFFSDIMGKHQYLPNGNLLITSTREGRALEVAPDGALVWEYNNAVAGGRNGMLSQVEILPPHMDRQFFQRLAAECPSS